MSQKILGTVLGIGLIVALCGCGAGEKKAGGAGEKATKVDSSPSPTVKTPAPETTPAPEATPAPADTAPPPSGPRYKTVHDPNATYGQKDLAVEGSYLKLDFTDLTPAQLNRVIHRMRTEMCTCGCVGDTIDQCLVNDPSCGTAVTLAKQILREEKLKG